MQRTDAAMHSAPYSIDPVPAIVPSSAPYTLIPAEGDKMVQSSSTDVNEDMSGSAQAHNQHQRHKTALLLSLAKLCF